MVAVGSTGSLASQVVVVDPSFALPWVLQEVHTPAATTKLQEWDTAGTLIVAPALFASEAASAFRKHIAAGEISDQDADEGLRQLLSSVDVLPHDADIARRALSIANEVGAGRAYDSMYAALAERIGCELWTGDERFHNACQGRFSWVRWVGEVQVPGASS